jgi:hypothetical protein
MALDLSFFRSSRCVFLAVYVRNHRARSIGLSLITPPPPPHAHTQLDLVWPDGSHLLPPASRSEFSLVWSDRGNPTRPYPSLVWSCGPYMCNPLGLLHKLLAGLTGLPHWLASALWLFAAAGWAAANPSRFHLYVQHVIELIKCLSGKDKR